MDAAVPASAALSERVRVLTSRLAAAEDAVDAQRLELAAAERELFSQLRRERILDQPLAASACIGPANSDILSLILLQLPVDARLRCREVCQAWRALLQESILWRACDLSSTSGVAAPTHTLMQAASIRAEGQMRLLDLSGWWRAVFVDGGSAGRHESERRHAH